MRSCHAWAVFDHARFVRNHMTQRETSQDMNAILERSGSARMRLSSLSKSPRDATRGLEDDGRTKGASLPLRSPLAGFGRKSQNVHVLNRDQSLADHAL